MKKEAIIKALCFFGLFAWMMNVIGGTAYHIHFHQYVFAVTNLATSAFAFPFVRTMWNKLLH